MLEGMKIRQLDIVLKIKILVTTFKTATKLHKNIAL